MPNLRSLLPAAALLSLFAAPVLADHATYELRGIVSEVYFNASTEKVEAIVEQPETHYLAFCDTPACEDDLYAALGTCTRLTGKSFRQGLLRRYKRHQLDALGGPRLRVRVGV